MASETTSTATTAVAQAAADLAEALQSPSSFSVEGLSQTNRSISEQIAGIEYLRKMERAARRRRPSIAGLIFHAIPPGTCDR